VSDFDQVRVLLGELGVDTATLRTVGRLHLVKNNRLWSLWRRLRASVDVSGFWPVILGPIEDHPVLDEIPDDDEVDDAIAQGLTLDVDDRLAELREAAETDAEGEYEVPPRGPTDATPGDPDAFHLAEKPGWLGLIRADEGYLVPGLLLWWGAANYDIGPADHVALLKHWHDRYGAELVALGSDMIELRVANPPVDPDEQLAVAEDQYWYCPDVVDQGVETVDALAIAQVASRRWVFWWD
jgi:hypothetical protein